MWAEATEAIQKSGTMVKSLSGYPIRSPDVAIADRQAEITTRIAPEFGFMPARRSRLGAPAQIVLERRNSCLHNLRPTSATKSARRRQSSLPPQ
jgi:phage terminase small subunit